MTVTKVQATFSKEVPVAEIRHAVTVVPRTRDGQVTLYFRPLSEDERKKLLDVRPRKGVG